MLLQAGVLPQIMTLQGYEEMFHSKERDKILIKGDPGMGKTTLLKKVGWDWSKRRSVQVVFNSVLCFPEICTAR